MNITFAFGSDEVLGCTKSSSVSSATAWAQISIKPKPALVLSTGKLRFVGRGMENTPTIDLQVPFRLSVTLSPIHTEGCARADRRTAGVEILQVRDKTTTRMRLRVPVATDADAPNLEEYELPGPTLDPSDFDTWVWPVLRHHAALHDAPCAVRLSRESLP